MERTFTDHVAWEAANGKFLSASLEWLRLLLQSRLSHNPPARTAADNPPVSRTTATPLAVALRGGRRPADTPIASGNEPTPEQVPSDRLSAAAAAVRQAEAISPLPALVSLASTFGLSRFERDTLLLCAAPELDPSLAALYAQAQGNNAMTYATFALALSALPDPAWAVVSPQQGLRYWRLIEINQLAGQALTASALRADERIVNVLKGLNYLDDRFEPLTSRLEADLDVTLPDSQEIVVDQVTRQWRSPDGMTPVVQLAGADDSSKRLVAAHAAARCGLLTYHMRASLLPSQAGDLDSLARLWQRETMLLPIALYLDVDDASPRDDASPPVGQFLDRVRCPTFLAVRESWPDLGSLSTLLDVEPPTPGERATAWRGALTPDTDQAFIESLAGQFALDVPAIRAIAEASGDAQQIWRTCRSRTRPRLDALAKRLEPRVSWDDLVLPEEQLTMLHQIADQVAHRTTVYEKWGFGERITRGLGVSTLFAGPSGVGKTMGAEVLANHLDLDLYRIDLSAIVSKYIGETEKNLRQLFDAAEGGGVILFFDEADALFGKRSEVKDAHDRYANTQTNDLLQRMEEYSGLSILATNMRRALDGAFMRRLRFIVEFPFPGLDERRAIWEKAFPERAPRGHLDFDRLAELRLTGGMARNIALNAAFLASASGSEITMPTVLQAARTEFRKLELPIREQDFAWFEERVL
jgi:hypothetical protein